MEAEAGEESKNLKVDRLSVDKSSNSGSQNQQSITSGFTSQTSYDSSDDEENKDDVYRLEELKHMRPV